MDSGTVTVGRGDAPADLMRVLVIEDDPEVAKMLALVLERAGYTTKISSDVPPK